MSLRVVSANMRHRLGIIVHTRFPRAELLSSRFIEDYFMMPSSRKKANYATSAPETGFMDVSSELDHACHESQTTRSPMVNTVLCACVVTVQLALCSRHG